MAAQLPLQLLLAMFVPAIAQLEMKFTKYPESVIAPLGDRVTFECEVNVPGERFVWRWKPDRDDELWTEVVDGDGKKIIPGLPGRSTKLEIEVMMNLETTWFQCVVWYGAVSLTSVPARLTVARLINASDRITAEERVVTAPLHNTVILHCKEPLSEPPAVLTWWKEGSKGKRRQLETPHGVLVIHNATSDDSGTYTCRATNELSGEVLDVAQKTHLNVQYEGSREVRFLESKEYVGVIDEDVLTMPVKPNGVLRLWCGAVSTPPPKISWSLEGEGELKAFANQHMLMISPFTPANEGVYACSANGIRRSWKVLALQPPHWDGNVSVSTPNEGGRAHVTCGNSFGQPPPQVYWVLNSEVLKNEKGIKANNTDLFIEHVEKRHAGIVQCFACNSLGCAYGAGMLSVVPLQIPDQDYPVETPKTRYSVQPPKRHNRKNPRKHKGEFDNFKNSPKAFSRDIFVKNVDVGLFVPAVMIPPSRPNVTRLNDESVMVSWSHDNQGLPIRFFKWSSGGEVEAEGFYVYYRAVSSAGAYEKVTTSGEPRALLLTHLAPDTSYDIKLQAYTAQAASEFSAIKTAKTLRPASGTSHSVGAGVSSEGAGGGAGAGAGSRQGAPAALVTAGGALGATALLVLLAIALLLCRRARRPTTDKEKGSVPETGATNGYIPAKVPITITANPMHSEGGDASVEMSFLHNNNTGNNDDTLPHSRKNGPAPRQYV
ncbi:hypothetical protein HF086_010655 [Spodoptera exigua]|uniref:Interference hedgehog n=1 Tax=Spodoptera exigua TaxID=7107 RepID=A0A922SH27_SPOEX|nr:hypothetical protein HF086_010655 [Spodoptera exigua]